MYTRKGSWFDTRHGHSDPTQSEPPGNLLFSQWPGLFPPWWNCRKNKPTSYVHLVPRRRIHGAIASYVFITRRLVHTGTICHTTFERGYCYWLESCVRRPERGGIYGKAQCKNTLLDYYATQLMCSKCRNLKTITQNVAPEQCDCKNVWIQIKDSGWSLERKL